MLAGVKDLARLLRRIAITAVGAVLLAVGVILLAAPGPGLLVIAVALAVFAIEYEWARRRLAAVRERARSAVRQAAASRAATFCAVLFGVGASGLGTVLIFTDVLPLSGVGAGAGAAIAGVTVLVTVAYSMRELRRAEKAEEDERAQPAKVTEEPGGPAGSQGPATAEHTIAGQRRAGRPAPGTRRPAQERQPSAKNHRSRYSVDCPQPQQRRRCAG
jgi:uncharacterized protein (TIGR02611 family)